MFTANYRPLVVKLGAAATSAVLLSGFATSVYAAPAPTTAGAAATSQTLKHAGAGRDHRKDHRAVREAIFAAEAKVLDMEPAQLKAALKAGRKLSDLAADRGISKDQFADRLATTLKPSLDRLVDGHEITAKMEERILKHIRDGHIPGWNGRTHRGAAQ